MGARRVFARESDFTGTAMTRTGPGYPATAEFGGWLRPEKQ